MAYEITTGFKTPNVGGATGSTQDLGSRYVTKNYLLDVYPNIASATGNRTAPGLWSWGNNDYGELGLNNNRYYSSPVQVGTLTTWKSISVGAFHTAAIKTDGTLWTWGNNRNGVLGNGNIVYYSSPVQVGALTNWKQVSCGDLMTAAIKTDGTLWTWGINSYGQLGLNYSTTPSYSSPIQVGALTTWKQVSCGYIHVLALKINGSLWAWGGNAATGTLGNNTVTSYSSPIQVGALTTWKQICAGNSSSAAIKTDGTLWTWGANTGGQLGNGNTTAYSSPIQVGALTSWKQVTMGGGSMHAVKTDGTLWAWGTNNVGRLGNNNSTNYSSPIQIGTLTNWKYVSDTYAQSIAIKTDGTLWAWGSNQYGQIGDGTITTTSSPVQIGTLTTWKNVGIGYGAYHSVSIQDGYI